MEPIRKTIYTEEESDDMGEILTVLRDWFLAGPFSDSWMCGTSFLLACTLGTILGSSVINQLIYLTSTQNMITGVDLSK